MHIRNNKQVSVGGWWPVEVVEQIDKAREKTFLPRSVFIRMIVTEHLQAERERKCERAEGNRMRRSEKEVGRGAQRTKPATHDTNIRNAKTATMEEDNIVLLSTPPTPPTEI